MGTEQAIAAMGGGSFERMRQRIWGCLRDPTIQVFSVLGWDGAGSSIITRQVIEELLEQQQGEDDVEVGTKLFDCVVWVSGEPSHAVLLKSIAESTEIHLGEGEHLTMEKIKHHSKNKRFLIIFGSFLVQQEQDIQVLWNLLPKDRTKLVVLIWSEGTLPSTLKGNVVIKDDWSSLSNDEAWDLVRHEVANLANDQELQTYLTNGEDSVMQCLSYLLLLPDGFGMQSMMLYWRAEGFLQGIENTEQWFGACTTLSSRFFLHGMLQDVEEPTISKSMRSKLTPFFYQRGYDRKGSWSYSPPPSSSDQGNIRLRRLLVRCGLGLEEAPKVDEWEQDNMERISLTNNNIKTLEDIGDPSPKCPCLSTLLLGFNPLLCKIPDDFFCNMRGLRVLDMSGTAITSLPSSLSSLTNLRLLALESCPSLETLPIPLLHALQKLEVLLLNHSPLPKLTESSLHMMQNLFRLRINEASDLKRLSLRGCHSFVELNPPKNLEVLDLSSTKVQDFDHFEFSSLTRLRCLDLLDTKNLTVVRWDEIGRLPQMLNWNQCSHGRSLAKEQFHADQGYCISVSDHKIFQSLSKDSKLWDEYFEKFRISLISCDHHQRPQQQQQQQQQPEEADNRFKRSRFIYRGIYEAKSKLTAESVRRSYHKCLEIDGTNDVPYGISGVLYHTEFFSLHNNNSITRLSQLGVENLDNLLECQIEKCRKMEFLITTRRTTASVQAFSRLENLLLFNLINLKSLCKGTVGKGSFACLKHMYLENCPRLLILFSSSVRLEKLETLEIRFCGKLEKVFEEDVAGQHAFPQLKELCLVGLGKLKSICNGDLPALEKLKIHGCRLLQKLPLLVANNKN